MQAGKKILQLLAVLSDSLTHSEKVCNDKQAETMRMLKRRAYLLIEREASK